jgi:hypothetical protein
MRPARLSFSLAAAIVAMVASVSPSASAAELDGSSNLVCAAVNVVACAEGPGCVQGLAKTFELPEFLFMDFKGKLVRAHRESGITEVSPFKNVEESNTQLIVQGVENGHGWGISIDRKTGRMTATLSGEQVSYMVFGACTAI